MKWMTAWGYRQQDYRSWPRYVKKQIQVIRVSSNFLSSEMKLVFSNEFGEEELNFEKIHINIRDSKTLNIKDSCVLEETINIPKGMKIRNQSVRISINPNDIIEIKTFLRNKTKITSGIVSYSRLEQEVLNYPYIDNYCKFPLDQKELFEMVKQNNRMFFIYGLSSIELLVEDDSRLIVAFGDSLTHQGFWVDALKNYLRSNDIHNISVVNQGIGGSRVLLGTSKEQDKYTRHGISGIERFENDVFGNNEIVSDVIVLHGINDLITKNSKNGPEEDINTLRLIEGLCYYAKITARHNSKIWVGTLLPMGNNEFWNEELETDREKINEWIREKYFKESFLDFAEKVSDQNANHILKKEFDCGDGLHISSQGGKALAKTVIENEKMDILRRKK